MAFNNFPFTNFQDLNLDWILQNVKTALANSAGAVTAAELASATATELKNFVNTYFDDLDVQQEINAKIDEMVESGEFAEIISSGEAADAINNVVSSTVNSWLSQNVTPVGSAVVVDSSLSVSGAAADAAVTGFRIGETKDVLDDTVAIGENLFNPNEAREKIGYWVNNSGVPFYDGDEVYCISDYIRLDGVSTYTALVASRVWLYDINKNYTSSISTNPPINIPSGTFYVIVGCKVATVNNTTLAKGDDVTEVVPYVPPYINPELIKVDDTLTEQGMPADSKAVGDAINEIDENVEIVNNIAKNTPLNKRNVCYFGNVPTAYYTGLLNNYANDGFGRNTDYQTLIQKFDTLVDGYYVTKTDKGLSSDNVNHMYEYDFIPVASTLTDKTRNMPTILITSGLHGFEKASIYGLYYFLKDLKENWANNSVLDYIKHHVILKIIPCCNPYGFNNNVYWNANGVNLNRNFATSGWELDGEPFTSQYSGASANSEPETQVVSALIDNNTDAIIFVDFHTNGQYSVNEYRKVNWFDFMGYNDALLDEFEYLACSHIETITAHFNSEYNLGLTNELCGYVTRGTYTTTATSDVYAIEKGILGHTVEGFTGFPNRQGFSGEALKGNSEIIGNWIAEVVEKYNNIL